MRLWAVALAPACVACVVVGSGCASGGGEVRVVDLESELTRTEARRIERSHERAMKAARARDAEEAERLYRESVESYPQFAAAWNNLGASLMAQERFMEAEEAFARAAELSPDDPRPVFNRGLLYLNRQYPRRAAGYFEEALERDPNYLRALRGSVRTDIVLREGTEQTLERIRTALLLEQDEAWRQYLQQQRLRLEARLDSEATGVDPLLGPG